MCVPVADENILLPCLRSSKVRILRLLTHRSVVGVREVFSDSPDYFYVVLERLGGGPVFDRIVKKVCI